VEAAPPGGEARPGSQAVIIVHGMGEQRPMGTLKSFVRSIWEEDPGIPSPGKPNPNMVWSKPDDRTGSLELRRITTRESISSDAVPNGVRTDFYELYWADLTAGSTWAQFVSWVRYLLFRRWSRVPRDVRSAWVLLWLFSALVLALSLVGILPESWWAPLGWLGGYRWLLVPAAGLLLLWLHTITAATFGRVVRYTRADPDNIAARAAVRERGLALLRALHRRSDYSRIVLVGHSLGSMLAFDLLAYFWSEKGRARTIVEGSEEFAALAAVETAAAKLSGAASEGEIATAAEAYRTAQSKLRRMLAMRPSSETEVDARWIISDFVTMGSPLTHSEFLIAIDEADLDNRKRAREVPTAPPYREELDPDVLEAAEATGVLPIADPRESSRLISYADPPGSRRWTLHHAAPFAVVRWTNIHDPSRLVLQGDVIGGPLSPALGRAITDIDLRALRGQSLWFSHTRYWRSDRPAAQLKVVRRAVNLLDL
jgi:hypothetical protein